MMFFNSLVFGHNYLHRLNIFVHDSVQQNTNKVDPNVNLEYTVVLIKGVARATFNTLAREISATGQLNASFLFAYGGGGALKIHILFVLFCFKKGKQP